MPNHGLSSEAIEILKEMHGKTALRFDSVEDGEAFIQKIRKVTERDATPTRSLYLPFCINSLLWLEDEDDGKEYIGLPISSYGRGAINALHAAGVI